MDTTIDLKLRFLKAGDLPKMYRSFKSSFADYSIPFSLTYPEFEKKFVEKLNINFGLSPAAFDNDELVAFIFTSTNYYQGLYTAYNGGTGVLPEYRGNRLVTKLYNFSLPVFKAHNLKQCVLEVLTNNNRAIKAYEGVGFVKTKYYNCFKLDTGILDNTNQGYEGFKVAQKPNWVDYVRCLDHLPSFLDTESMINENLKNETVVEYRQNGSVLGYAIFQPVPGRISHLAVHREHRRQGIGTKLLSYIHASSKNQRLSIINIDRAAVGMKSFLIKLGFKNQIDQHEMVLPI